MDILMSNIPGGKTGTIGKIKVKVGDKVKLGDTLALVETGKGNRPIKATCNGEILEIFVNEGENVKSNQKMFNLKEIEIQEEEALEEIREVKQKPILMSLLPGKTLGTVGKIKVKVGDKVKAGDTIALVETGKGNRPVKVSNDATIINIYIEEGQKVGTRKKLFEIEYVDIRLVPASELPKEEKEIKTDLLVIGAGPGGYVAAIFAAKNGKKVTIVEKENLGGTCLNVGCIPTKALIKSASIYQDIKNMKSFGFELDGKVNVDMKAIIARKNDIKSKLVGGIGYLMSKNKIEVVSGTTRFINENEVEAISSTTITKIKANDIIIATGSKISKLPIKGLDKDVVLNSTQALDLDVLPKSITIIGGGVIGMEFAFIYASLGAKVNVIEFMPTCLTMVDIDAQKEIMNIAREKGINIYTNSKVKEIKESAEGEAITIFETNKDENLLVSEKVLVAIGREPNIQDLDLEKAQIKTWDNKKGIEVDNHMRTNKKHIYAIGDCTNIIQLAHVASHQGIVAVNNILGHNEEMKYDAVPNVIFTMPEIASVGLNQQECEKKEMNIKVSKFDYVANGKALTLGKTQGFIKLIEDIDNNKIVGATIIGADASALIASLTLAINNNLTKEDIQNTIFAHPTTSEVIHEAAMGLSIGALHS